MLKKFNLQQILKSKFILSLMVGIWCLFLLFMFSELTYFFKHKKIYFLANNVEHKNLPSFRQNLSPFFSKKSQWRIITLGGSTTYAMGLNENQSWPLLLEKKIASLKNPWQVINLGLLGGNLQEMLLNFEHLQERRFLREDFLFNKSFFNKKKIKIAGAGFLDLNPKIVIVAPQINEFAPDLFYDLRVNSYGKLFFLKSGLENFALGFYIKRFLFRTNQRPQNQDEIQHTAKNLKQELIEFINKREKSVEANLEEVVTFWQNHGAKVILVQFPTLFNPTDNVKNLKMAQQELLPNKNLWEWKQEKEILTLTEVYDQKVMTNISLKRKIPYWKLFWSLKGLAFQKRLSYYLDAIHLNAKGQVNISDELAKKLEEYVSPNDPKKLGGQSTLTHVYRK